MNRRSAMASLMSLASGCAFAQAGTPLPAPLSILRPTDPPRLVADLKITTGDGMPVTLAQYRQRFIVLNLWASWCFPCREEMPGLARLAARSDLPALTVLPVAVERDGAEAVAKFYRQTGIANLPILLGGGENIAEVFQEWGLPFTVLIGRGNAEVGRVTGAARWDDPGFLAWLGGRAA